jgi:hypothetical protein
MHCTKAEQPSLEQWKLLDRSQQRLKVPRAITEQNMAMSPVEFGTKNYCACEGQQQFRSESVVLKLRCNELRAYTQRPTIPFVEEEAPVLNAYMYKRKQKSWSHISTRLKPKMTVLARVSSNLTDRPTDHFW